MAVVAGCPFLMSKTVVQLWFLRLSLGMAVYQAEDGVGKPETFVYDTYEEACGDVQKLDVAFVIFSTVAFVATVWTTDRVTELVEFGVGAAGCVYRVRRHDEVSVLCEGELW